MKFLIFLFLIWPAMPATAWAQSDGDERDLLLSQFLEIKAGGESTLTMPIFLRSGEKDKRLFADVYSEVSHPFKEVVHVLTSTRHWCEFMPLNLNIKACLFQVQARKEFLTLYAGRKFYQTPDEAEQIRYQFKVEKETDDYLKVILRAKEGPYGTRDYMIMVQVTPIKNSTLIHVRSGYTTSFWSRVGTGVYLSTLGNDKVGFTVEGYDKDKQPRYIKGVQGITERNTVRYYLSLLALLQSLNLPREQQFEYQINSWFEMTERFKRQLHEMDKVEYLDAKRRERQNQLALQNKLQ